MSRAGEMAALEAYIRTRLQRKKLLLMTHAVVGYPSLEANMAMLEAMQRADADLVELPASLQRAHCRRAGLSPCQSACFRGRL